MDKKDSNRRAVSSVTNLVLWDLFVGGILNSLGLKAGESLECCVWLTGCWWELARIKCQRCASSGGFRQEGGRREVGVPGDLEQPG